MLEFLGGVGIILGTLVGMCLLAFLVTLLIACLPGIFNLAVSIGLIIVLAGLATGYIKNSKD